MESTYELPSQKTIYKTALSMAWPAVLESFLIALTGFLDSIMVSSQGDEAIAAVGLTGQPKFIGLAIFISIGIAVSSIVARRRGEQNQESANRLLKLVLIVVVILSLVVGLAYLFFSRDIMLLAGAQEDTVDISTQYLTIIMVAMIFNTVTMIVNAAQRGAGNTRISMVTNTTSNVVNVIFNFLLIGGNFGFPALGVNGAAIATVIGTMVACAMSIRSLFKKESFVYLKAYKGIATTKADIKSLIDISASAFTEQFFLRVGFFLFNLT
ncbi:MAG: MATE family efflux transporter, partial [Clostridia bacterium]